MFKYNISFINGASEQCNITLPLDQTVINVLYSTDNKRYLGFLCEYSSEEKDEFLSKIQQINLETNSNFVISIVDDNDASYTTEFIRFNKLTPGEIQESLNLNSIYNKTEGNLKFQLRLACGLGEINE